MSMIGKYAQYTGIYWYEERVYLSMNLLHCILFMYIFRCLNNNALYIVILLVVDESNSANECAFATRTVLTRGVGATGAGLPSSKRPIGQDMPHRELRPG